MLEGLVEWLEGAFSTNAPVRCHHTARRSWTMQRLLLQVRWGHSGRICFNCVPGLLAEVSDDARRRRPPRGQD